LVVAGVQDTITVVEIHGWHLVMEVLEVEDTLFMQVMMEWVEVELTTKVLMVGILLG
jgi:hypothetical protein